MLCHWDIGEKDFFFVYFKMTPQRDNGVKVFALLRAGHKVSEAANLVGFTHLSTRSRSAWTKVSTDE